MGIISVSAFFDSSNVSLSPSEESDMNSELDSQRTTTNNMSALEDNAPFDFLDIFSDPMILLKKQLFFLRCLFEYFDSTRLDECLLWMAACCLCLNLEKSCAYPRAGNDFSSLTGGFSHKY